MLHLDKKTKSFLVYCTVNFCVCLLRVPTEMADNVTIICSPVFEEERPGKRPGEKRALSTRERLGGFSASLLAV